MEYSGIVLTVQVSRDFEKGADIGAEQQSMRRYTTEEVRAFLTEKLNSVPQNNLHEGSY